MPPITKRPSEVTPLWRRETSVWDVYNHSADRRNSELLKGWNNNLHILLIFAAVFASILPGVLVESMKLLQVNPQDTTNAILQQISLQLANTTATPYTPPNLVFRPTNRAVAANALLFASLCVSLIAALAAVAALRWVNEYDTGFSTFDARKRALVRHARYTGTERIAMDGIISTLPLLLHASIFLFFAGMTIWVRITQADKTLSSIGIGANVIAMILYIFNMVVTADYTRVPLRHSVLRGLRLLILSPALVVAFSVLYFYGQLIRSPGLMKALTDPIWRLIDGASSEQAIFEDPALELQLVKWTASNVDTTRLLHAIEQAYPSLLTNKTLSGPWNLIGDQKAKLLLDQAKAKLLLNQAKATGLYNSDLNEIRIMVNLWVAIRPQYPKYWSWKAVSEDNWADWKPAQQLIGPLDVQGALDEGTLAVITKLIEIGISEEGERSSQALNKITETLLKSTSPLPPYIVRYATSSLSTYVWTHGRSTFYDRVVDLLINLLALPADGFHSSPLFPMERSLVLSALYSVAFGKEGGPRRYWSLRHPFLDATELSDNFKIVQSLHLAITNHYAGAALQAASEHHARKYLRYFACLLAYTPIEDQVKEHRAKERQVVQRAKTILARGDPGIPTEDRVIPAALSSLIWIFNIGSISPIHEYLEVILSCRRRLPSVKPMWRDWPTSEELEKYADIEANDRMWLTKIQSDRRLTELLSAFDQLISNDFPVERHLVMVQIVIDDLQDDTGSDYDRYYTRQRKKQLKELRDPALRLIGARAANIPYTGGVPLEGDPLWRASPWQQAMAFWCRSYRDCRIKDCRALIQPCT